MDRSSDLLRPMSRSAKDEIFAEASLPEKNTGVTAGPGFAWTNSAVKSRSEVSQAEALSPLEGCAAEPAEQRGNKSVPNSVSPCASGPFCAQGCG